MVILYVLGGYALVTYAVGAVIFLWGSRKEGAYVRNWGLYYFALSPCLMPILAYCWLMDH